MKKLALVCAALAAVGLFASMPARAQSSSSDVLAGGCGSITYDSGRPMHDTQDTTGKKCVNATVSVSASITGFTPAAVGTPIAVTTGGVTGTLPAGTVVVASNVGTTNTAYCALGAATTTAWQPITPNGGWFAFTVGAATQLSCITTASTTTVNLVGGAGLPTGTGGGGGGSGGGGGAVTLAAAAVSAGAYVSGSVLDGAIVTIGALADAAWTSGNGTVVAVLKAISGSNTTIATNTGTTNTDLGPPGATACATDTGSCSVNALLQRIAQRLSTLVAGFTGAVTVADGADVAQGSQSDVAWVSGPGTTIGLLKALVAQGPSAAITAWAGSTLGAITAYGTSPGAVLVPAFNGFITGSTNFAAPAAALPSLLAGICVDDGTSHCVVPKALSSAALGVAPTDFIGVSSTPGSLPIPVTTTSADVAGSYCLTAKTGLMAAGLASAAPIVAFRTSTTALVIVKKVTMSAENVTTAFVAGTGSFDMFIARSFTASDTGGAAVPLTTNNGKLRTSFTNPASTDVADFRVSSTATLTAGTRTLDGAPFAAIYAAIPTTIDAQIVNPNTILFDARISDQPLQFATNEGFVILGTMPGTGTWSASFTVCWDVKAAF